MGTFTNLFRRKPAQSVRTAPKVALATPAVTTAPKLVFRKSTPAPEPAAPTSGELRSVPNVSLLLNPKITRFEVTSTDIRVRPRPPGLEQGPPLASSGEAVHAVVPPPETSPAATTPIVSTSELLGAPPLPNHPVGQSTVPSSLPPPNSAHSLKRLPGSAADPLADTVVDTVTATVRPKVKTSQLHPMLLLGDPSLRASDPFFQAAHDLQARFQAELLVLQITPESAPGETVFRAIGTFIESTRSSFWRGLHFRVADYPDHWLALQTEGYIALPPPGTQTQIYSDRNRVRAAFGADGECWCGLVLIGAASAPLGVLVILVPDSVDLRPTRAHLAGISSESFRVIYNLGAQHSGLRMPERTLTQTPFPAMERPKAIPTLPDPTFVSRSFEPPVSPPAIPRFIPLKKPSVPSLLSAQAPPPRPTPQMAPMPPTPPIPNKAPPRTLQAVPPLMRPLQKQPPQLPPSAAGHHPGGLGSTGSSGSTLRKQNFSPPPLPSSRAHSIPGFQPNAQPPTAPSDLEETQVSMGIESYPGSNSNPEPTQDTQNTLSTYRLAQGQGTRDIDLDLLLEAEDSDPESMQSGNRS